MQLTIIFRNAITILCFIFAAFNIGATHTLTVQLKQVDGVFHCKRTKQFTLEKAKAELKTATDTTLIACYLHQIAVQFYNYEKDYIKATNWNKKALKLRRNYNDGLLWKSNLNLGLCYKDLNDSKLAIQHFLQAYQIKGYKRPRDSIKILKNLAYCYSKIGDHENAFNYAEKATKVNASESYKNNALRTYSQVLLLQKDSINADKSIQFFEKTLEYALTTNDQQSIITGLSNLGVAHKNIGDADAELEMYKQALSKTDENDLDNKATIFNNIATHYQEIGDYEMAIENLNKSLSILKEYYEVEYDYEYAARYQNLGDNYTALKQNDIALIYFQKALIHLTDKFRNEDVFVNPSTKDKNTFVYSVPDIIEVFHLKAVAAYEHYLTNKDQKYLHLANKCYQALFDYHNQLQKDISTENSRLFQAENIQPYIENALEVIYELQENEEVVSEACFRFMEKNKATVLLQSMNEADALQFANLPGSLLEQEKDLKIAITFYKQELNEAIYYEEVAKAERLENLLFDEKQKYTKLINNLESNYPDYYRLKYQQNQTKLSNIQNTLNDETALLEYFVGESFIYIFAIQQKYVRLYRLVKPANWKQLINDLRYAITDINVDRLDLFTKTAATLYKQLVSEPLCDLQDGITNLQIIPDAELNYIPFEVLLTDEEVATKGNTGFKKMPYLLKTKSVGYSYSAALLLENIQNNASERTFSYVGYAPEYKNQNYDDLPVARQTVQNLANTLNGKAYLNKQANLLNFAANKEDYTILHLYMHGVLNDENPLSSYLAFTPVEEYRLFAYDLYNMNINADIAILNACNTGSGELQKGEGVMSLSRAFTYAGCPSIVLSLWQIPEAATSEITTTFIKNLQAGHTKDVALQQAKLAYLENQLEWEASPAYWAGLVLSGNLQCISIGNN